MTGMHWFSCRPPEPECQVTDPRYEVRGGVTWTYGTFLVRKKWRSYRTVQSSRSGVTVWHVLKKPD